MHFVGKVTRNSATAAPTVTTLVKGLRSCLNLLDILRKKGLMSPGTDCISPHQHLVRFSFDRLSPRRLNFGPSTQPILEGFVEKVPEIQNWSLKKYPTYGLTTRTSLVSRVSFRSFAPGHSCLSQFFSTFSPSCEDQSVAQLLFTVNHALNPGPNRKMVVHFPSPTVPISCLSCNRNYNDFARLGQSPP